MAGDETRNEGVRTLSDEDIKRVLKKEPVGVLSMCDEGVPYGIPMSFGYHDSDIYFEFGTTDGGRKFDIIDENPVVSLTVYSLDRSRWGDSTANVLPTGFAWASVVATGEVKKLENPSEGARDAVFEARRPSPANPWGESMSDTDLTLYRMVVDSVEGRTAGGKNPDAED